MTFTGTWQWYCFWWNSWFFFFFDSLKNVLKRGYYKEFVGTVRHDFLVFLICTFYLFITKLGNAYSRGVLLMTLGIYFVSSYSTRLLWKKRLGKKMGESGSRSLLIVTSSKYLDTVVDNIRNNNYQGFYMAGIAVLDQDMTGQIISGVRVVANLDTVVEYVCREWVDEVFLNLPKSAPIYENLNESFLEMGVTVHQKLARIHEFTGQKQRVERLGNYTVLTTSINMITPRQALCKRVLDICGGLVGCLLTGILFLFVGPAIYLRSPGPVFFSQERVGKNGKKFRIYKFRSMYMDAEERKKELMARNDVKDGMMFKMDDDPRIIRGIGHFIRKTSIDEFPQFWNVLKGDMSLVGTRPPTVDEWEKYELHHRARLAIKPGLTGMWQVSGRSDITDFEEVVRLDTQYISDWSFGLDLKILWKTVEVVLKGEGSK